MRHVEQAGARSRRWRAEFNQPAPTNPGAFHHQANRRIACRYSAPSKEPNMMVKQVIDGTEKVFLVVIAVFTVIAMGQEMFQLYERGKVALEDLLLMFIFAEVLGMLGAFYARLGNLITLPLFIAMTALSRLIVLQSKETDPIVLVYQSGAILLIAAACWVVSRMRTAQ
jgi:protein PsiE